jgi:hypothetical protein
MRGTSISATQYRKGKGSTKLLRDSVQCVLHRVFRRIWLLA